MFKISELLKKEKNNLRNPHKKRIPKRKINKMKIQTVKVKKSSSLNLVMIKWNNIIGLLLFKDGMGLIISWKYFPKNTMIWVQCSRFIGNPSLKIWMLLFLFSLEKWSILPSKMMLFCCMKCLKKNWRNTHHF